MVKFKIEKVEENGFLSSGAVEGERDLVMEELAVGVDTVLMQMADGDFIMKELLGILFTHEFSKKIKLDKKYTDME